MVLNLCQMLFEVTRTRGRITDTGSSLGGLSVPELRVSYIPGDNPDALPCNGRAHYQLRSYVFWLITHFLVWFRFSEKLLYFIFPYHHSVEFKTLDHISAPLPCKSGLHTPSRKEYCYLTERMIFNNWIYLGHMKLCSDPHINMQLPEWFIHHPAGCVHIFFQHII